MRQTVRLDYPRKNGTLRANLRSVYEQTGKVPKDLRLEPLARHERWLWETFWDLSAGRPVGFGGPMRIPHTEFAAYAALQQVDLEDWELGALRRMDGAFMVEISLQQERKG